ncbi:GTPase-activating protein, partial [Spiromyces aspiralis]
LDEEYQSYKEQKSPFEKLIRQDVKRTLRNIDLYSEEDGAGQQALFNVLKAYSLHDTEVGYCQGLSYVVGPLLLNMSEVEAFRVLVKLMDNYKLRGYFTPSMENLRQTLYQFERLFGEQLPLLFNHFRSQNITSTMYASQWFMTLFACRLPIELVTRVYDVVIAEGIESLLRFALTLLRRSQTHLMTLGFDEIIKFLNSESLFDYYTARNPNEFVQDAARVTSVSVQRLRRLAEEYHRVNQSGLDDERYLDVLNEKNRVLERENSHLLAKLQDLSLEHSDLTSQLVQVRKEHEELAGLVQELRKQLLIEREEAK